MHEVNANYRIYIAVNYRNSPILPYGNLPLTITYFKPKLCYMQKCNLSYKVLEMTQNCIAEHSLILNFKSDTILAQELMSNHVHLQRK